MTTITNAYKNALLADATYALNEDGLQNKTGKDISDLLATRMTPTVAKYKPTGSDTVLKVKRRRIKFCWHYN